MLTELKKNLLNDGVVIPAHPLALTEERKIDEETQAGLTRYYINAGAGGVAVGVHTTQFAIREKGMLKPVLKIARDTAQEMGRSDDFLLISGACGDADQEEREAELAAELGYDACLISPGGTQNLSEAQLIKRAERAAKHIPLFGFYLQPAVGGRYLSFDFWKDFGAIDNVAAVKFAPFDRYFTLEAARGLCASGRVEDIAFYTGNDDNIVIDLLTKYRIEMNGKIYEKQIVGGLLGHWAVFTEGAVKMLNMIKECRKKDVIPAEMFTLAEQVTDMNAAVFDPKNGFKGCIAGVHYILQKYGIMKNILCLDENETVSPGQAEEIERICREYPQWAK